jgi:hypothetical protein
MQRGRAAGPDNRRRVVYPFKKHSYRVEALFNSILACAIATSTAINSAITIYPISASIAAVSREFGPGTISPYPSVVHVTTEKYIAPLMHVYLSSA